jgi:hypothetical protein
LNLVSGLWVHLGKNFFGFRKRYDASSSFGLLLCLLGHLLVTSGRFKSLLLCRTQGPEMLQPGYYLLGLSADRDHHSDTSPTHVAHLTDSTLETSVRHSFGLPRVNVNNHSVANFVTSQKSSQRRSRLCPKQHSSFSSVPPRFRHEKFALNFRS